MADTARSASYLLNLLVPGQPEPAAQTTLLAQGARDLITSLPQLTAYAANYNFPAETPAVILTGSTIDPNRRLTAGQSATVRFASVPAGINGTDVSHYLYISDGASSEAVLITGGTASASNRSNATITFTPASNHSGAWTIVSASGGIMEAALSSPNMLIQLPQGYTQLYASVTLPTSCPGVQGNGYLQSLIGVNFRATSIFVLATTSQTCIFQDFQIIPLSGNMTAGAAIDLTAAANVVCRNLFLGAGGGGFCVYEGVRTSSVGSNRVYLDDMWILAEFRALDIQLAYLSLKNVQALSERTSSNFIANGAALYLKGIAGANIVSFIHDSGVFSYGILVDTAAAGNVNEIQISNLYLDNWITAGIGVIGTGAAASWEVSSFRIVDDNGIFADSVGGRGIAVIAACDGWQVGNGSILYAYGYGVEVAGSARNLRFTNVSIASGFTSAGNGAFVVNAGTPSLISLVGCGLGVSVDGGTTTSTYGFNNSRAVAGLTIVGCHLDGSTQANKLVLSGTETSVEIASNNGIGDVAKSVAAAATLAFPVMDQDDVLVVSGNTNVTAVTGLREGQTGVLICTGTPAWTNGNNIDSPTVTLSAKVAGKFAFTGGKLYVSA